MTLALAIYFVMLFLGFLAGQSRGHPMLGLALALFIGPIGVIAALFLPAPIRRDRYVPRRRSARFRAM